MTYDLRRLRLAGLISRIERTNHYALPPDQAQHGRRHRDRRGRAHWHGAVLRGHLGRRIHQPVLGDDRREHSVG